MTYVIVLLQYARYTALGAEFSFSQVSLCGCSFFVFFIDLIVSCSNAV